MGIATLWDFVWGPYISMTYLYVRIIYKAVVGSKEMEIEQGRGVRGGGREEIERKSVVQ